MNPFYKDYSQYMSEKFPGIKVQKISINAGFSCPNRDGTIGRGGCIYCDPTSFTPGYCFGNDSVRDQLEAGKRFFARKYPEMKYLAYFQSFTNTFTGKVAKGEGERNLRALYEEALTTNDVVGLIIGSRPDCFSSATIDLLAELNRRRPVFVEIGAESSHDGTLRKINRGHTWRQTCETVRRLAGAGLPVGLHLIFGLPGEEEEMMMETVRRVCALPVESLKFHHLQVISGTRLHSAVIAGKLDIHPFGLEEYLDLCVKVVETVPRNIAIERFLASSPPVRVVAPKWGLKNYEFTNLLLNRLKNRKRP
ncbi:MAG: TIGR01212 family radical SAM protein [Muribaculaceae bacterium]|nr:TIGR01212 family radical SAM protein [Muribaculaceae bacterium]